MTVQKIDPDTLRRLWMGGVPSKDIAEVFGCKYPAVNRRAEAMDLPKRGAGFVSRDDLSAEAKAKVEPPKEIKTDVSLEDAVAYFGGSYAARYEISKKFGVPLNQVTKIFHRLRASA